MFGVGCDYHHQEHPHVNSEVNVKVENLEKTVNAMAVKIKELETKINVMKSKESK